MPTASGPGIYLSLRARMPGVPRDAVDRAAVEGTSIVEVPSGPSRPAVLVPREDMALALRLHGAPHERHILRYLTSNGIEEPALRSVESAVTRALQEGPMPAAELRTALSGLDRTPLLAAALIALTLRGVIRRLPAAGRIDAAAYQYEWLHPEDRPDLDGEGDAAAIAVKIVERFLRWHGPATLDELAGWSELPKRALRPALAAIRAERVTIGGWTEDGWLLPADMPAWRAFAGEDDDHVALLPFRDPFVWSRQRPAILTERPAAPVLDRTGKRSRVGSVAALYHHSIVSGGELVGVWEFDPRSHVIVTRLWSEERGLRRRVAKAAEATARFIDEQLGDAKLAAVDPPARRARRLAFCRTGS